MQTQRLKLAKAQFLSLLSFLLILLIGYIRRQSSKEISHIIYIDAFIVRVTKFTTNLKIIGWYIVISNPVFCLRLISIEK